MGAQILPSFVIKPIILCLPKMHINSTLHNLKQWKNLFFHIYGGFQLPTWPCLLEKKQQMSLQTIRFKVTKNDINYTDVEGATVQQCLAMSIPFFSF